MIFAIILSVINIGGTFIEHQTEKEILILKQNTERDDTQFVQENRSKSYRVTEKTTRTLQYAEKKDDIDLMDEAIGQKDVSIAHAGKKNTEESATIDRDHELKLNPNTAGISDLVKIGLSEGQARNLVNYREKVAPFENKNNLLKLYTLDEEDFQRIADHIVVPKQASEKNESLSKTQEKTEFDNTRTIDINSASAVEWEELRGIGPYYAGKIVRYREKLGGFSDVDQIKETWDLPSEVIDNNRQHLSVETPIQALDILSADFKTLIQHPYLNKKQVRLLLKLQGKNIKIDEKIMRDIFSDEEWHKIKPYLKWQTP